MEPIGIFFAAVFALGIIGAFAVLAVNRFHNKDSQARRSFKAKDYDSREMYE